MSKRLIRSEARLRSEVVEQNMDQDMIPSLLAILKDLKHLNEELGANGCDYRLSFYERDTGIAVGFIKKENFDNPDYRFKKIHNTVIDFGQFGIVHQKDHVTAAKSPEAQGRFARLNQRLSIVHWMNMSRSRQLFRFHQAVTIRAVRMGIEIF